MKFIKIFIFSLFIFTGKTVQKDVIDKRVNDEIINIKVLFYVPEKEYENCCICCFINDCAYYTLYTYKFDTNKSVKISEFKKFFFEQMIKTKLLKENEHLLVYNQKSELLKNDQSFFDLGKSRTILIFKEN